ncbi:MULTISPECIES: hypothetical protein [Pseudomonas]|uniref:hypothetical protein n=1 Tax=Pseudomonas TaxID=286 RepID=UPI002E25E4AC|nr:hypothetical protein [Pseudomonas sp. JH-2]
MHHLAHYAAAILATSTQPRIVRESTTSTHWHENGFEVRQSISTYEFSDGVIIRRMLERDDYPPDETLLCAECWITYEVVRDGPAAAAVQPRRMTFDSTCREAFWLRFHTAPAAGSGICTTEGPPR